MQNNKQNYSVSSLPVNHIHSSSSASIEFSQIVAGDIHNSRKYFNNEKKSVETIPSEYEIEYKGNVCIIKFTQNKFSIFLKYRDEEKIYGDDRLEQQLSALIPDNKALVTNIISTIRADRNKSC